MRLIDADALKARIMLDAPSLDSQGSAITKAFILAMIDSESITPTIDAVPVIRCKNCKHAVMTVAGDSAKYCELDYDDDGYLIEHYYDKDWYCPAGELKELKVKVNEICIKRKDRTRLLFMCQFFCR